LRAGGQGLSEGKGGRNLAIGIPNVANVGGLQIQGVKGDVVVLYFESLTTQKLKSSGVPER
jgi:hypothetical protein